MIVLPFIQENNQEEICAFCEKHILGCKRSTYTFLCEGRWCEDANEMFYEEYPEKANITEFTYYPSNEIKYLEIHLDQKIMFFERMLEQQIETLKQF